jgi:hypothetical protein
MLRKLLLQLCGRGYGYCWVLRDKEAVVAVVWRRLFMLLLCCEIRKLLLQLCGGGYSCCCGAVRYGSCCCSCVEEVIHDVAVL